MKKGNPQQLQQFILDLQQERKPAVIRVEPEHQVQTLLGTIKLSTSVSGSYTEYPRYNQLTEDLKHKEIRMVGAYSVKEEGDKDCCITGAAFLDDGTLLICDCNNCKVKHLSRDMKLLSSIVLPCGPVDITLTSQQEAVVTLPVFQQIQYLTVKPILKLGRSVKLSRMCWGITNHKKKLYVSCTEPVDLLALEQTGEILRSYGLHGDGSHLFVYPGYMTVRDDGVMFVSDRDTCTVAGVNQDGETVYKFRNDNLKSPRQLLVDSREYVYVCGWGSNNIQILTPEGKLYRELIKEGERLELPTSMAYRGSDNILVVGMCDKNEIFVYRFV